MLINTYTVLCKTSKYSRYIHIQVSLFFA